MAEAASTPPSIVLQKNYLGGGAYADVWEGVDRLGRTRAVKVVRSDKGSSGFVERQARALARIDHPNVVRVHDLVEVVVPDTNERALGIVMDKVDGSKLSVAVAAGLSRPDATRIGLGIVDGVEAIHDGGLFHNDLHDENVLVGPTSVVIIDILHTKSASALSTAPREARLAQDVRDVWVLLRNLLIASSTPAQRVVDFDRHMATQGLGVLRAKYLQALNEASPVDLAAAVSNAKAKFIDSAFIRGAAYAEAVVEAIPAEAGAQTLIDLLAEGAFRQVHRPALRRLFGKLPPPDCNRVSQALAGHLDRETPDGKWPSPIILLSATARLSWPLLPAMTRLRLESILVKSVAEGHLDIHSPLGGTRGALGTWSIHLWQEFQDPTKLAQTIVERLRNGWYTANYVAESFFPALPAIAQHTSKEAEMIEAIKSAYQDDAKKVKQNLDQLPAKWQEQIRAEA